MGLNGTNMALFGTLFPQNKIKKPFSYISLLFPTCKERYVGRVKKSFAKIKSIPYFLMQSVQNVL